LWERSSKLYILSRTKEKNSLEDEIERIKAEYEEMKDTQHSKIEVLENDLKKMTGKKIKSEARVRILETEAT
jgi:hypothetical protein